MANVVNLRDGKVLALMIGLHANIEATLAVMRKRLYVEPFIRSTPHTTRCSESSRWSVSLAGKMHLRLTLRWTISAEG